MGIWLNEVNNVTIKNLNIGGFSMSGIYLTASCNNTIYNNSLSSNDYCGIDLENASNYNNVFSNNMTNNGFSGIRLSNNSPIPNVGSPSDFNNIYQNQVNANLQYGIFLSNSSNNKIYTNTIANNTDAGIEISSSSNNKFYHNVVVDNSPNAKVGGEIDYFTGTGVGGEGGDIWDKDQTGNYWGDYNGADANHNGIGDSPYKIDANNIDYYPLMSPFKGLPSQQPTLSPANKQTSAFPTLLVIAFLGVSAALVSAGLIINYKKKKTNIKR